MPIARMFLLLLGCLPALMNGVTHVDVKQGGRPVIVCSGPSILANVSRQYDSIKIVALRRRLDETSLNETLAKLRATDNVTGLTSVVLLKRGWSYHFYDNLTLVACLLTASCHDTGYYTCQVTYLANETLQQVAVDTRWDVTVANTITGMRLISSRPPASYVIRCNVKGPPNVAINWFTVCLTRQTVTATIRHLNSPAPKAEPGMCPVASYASLYHHLGTTGYEKCNVTCCAHSRMSDPDSSLVPVRRACQAFNWADVDLSLVSERDRYPGHEYIFTGTVVVLIAITVLIVLCACTCGCLSDDKSNKEKRRLFHRWLMERKRKLAREERLRSLRHQARYKLSSMNI